MVQISDGGLGLELGVGIHDGGYGKGRVLSEL